MKDLPDFDVWSPREPPNWSPSRVYPDLGGARTYLDRLRVHHFELARRILSADDGTMRWTDMLIVAIAARSYSLVDGFLWAHDTWNPVVAAPVLRLQIDNLTRLSYAAHHENTDELAEYILGGGELRRRTDATGQKLTDARLVALASEHHPWIPSVYAGTSAWVHFSPELMHSVFHLKDGDGEDPSPTLGFSIPISRERIPEPALRELLELMIRATEHLFGYFEAWESRKGLRLGEVHDLTTGDVEGRTAHTPVHTPEPKDAY